MQELQRAVDMYARVAKQTITSKQVGVEHSFCDTVLINNGFPRMSQTALGDDPYGCRCHGSSWTISVAKENERQWRKQEALNVELDVAEFVAEEE